MGSPQRGKMSMYKDQGRGWEPLFLCIGREEHGKVGEGSVRESTRLRDDKGLRVRAPSLMGAEDIFGPLSRDPIHGRGLSLRCCFDLEALGRNRKH